MIAKRPIRFYWSDDLTEHDPRDSVNTGDFFGADDGDLRPLTEATGEERSLILHALDEREATVGAPHGAGSMSSAIADIIRTWTDAELVERLHLDSRELPFYRARPYFFTLFDFAMVHAHSGLNARQFFEVLAEHGYVSGSHQTPTSEELS